MPGRTYKLNREPSAAPARKPRALAARPALKGALSKPQMRTICMIAADAAKALGITGWREVEEWRKDQQRTHFGLDSLTSATQEQYPEIKAHFEACGGATDRAFNTALRGQDNDRRIARWHLEKAIRESGLRMAYAITVCKNQFRCGLEDATTRQLWNLVYTIRNRGNAKRRKDEASGADCPF